MLTGLYCYPVKGYWIGFRFVCKGNVQLALDIRFATLWDAQRYAEKNKLRLVTLEDDTCLLALG
jgi:hypothetical protein